MSDRMARIRKPFADRLLTVRDVAAYLRVSTRTGLCALRSGAPRAPSRDECTPHRTCGNDGAGQEPSKSRKARRVPYGPLAVDDLRDAASRIGPKNPARLLTMLANPPDALPDPKRAEA